MSAILMSDVATKKLHESDRAIIWELKLEPGESTGVHRHTHDYFFHVLSGSTLETIDEHGQSLGLFEAKTGKTYNFTLDGDELVFPSGRAPAKHEAKNVGSEPYYEILVELK